MNYAMKKEYLQRHFSKEPSKFEGDTMIVDDGVIINKKFDNTDKQTAACRNMFRWLYQKGILEKVSFLFDEYKKESGEIKEVKFALDTTELLPYKEQMEKSGIKNWNLAVDAIFDKNAKGSQFSGAISLCHPMLSYRVNRCVCKFWKSYSEHVVASRAMLDLIHKISIRHGANEAVKSLWDINDGRRLDYEINIAEDLEGLDDVALPGAAYAWFHTDNVNIGVEFEYYVQGETNSSAIYFMEYDEKYDDMMTDHSNYVHYEVDFSDEDWQKHLTEQMYILLLQYYYKLDGEPMLEYK